MLGRARNVVMAVGLLAVVLAGLGARAATAATPSGGSVSSASPTFTWTGATPIPVAATTTGCPVDGQPTCDQLALTIGALDAHHDVIVAIAADDATDVNALYVYGPDGTRVGTDESASANHTVLLHQPAPGVYSVRAEALLFVPPSTGSYRGKATVVPAGSDIALDDEGACASVDGSLETPPDILETALLHDDGRRIRLDVLVLLDRVDEAYARHFFGDVAVPYAEIGIDVTPTFLAIDDVPADMTTTTDLIDLIRHRFPEGKVPVAYDVVELLTSKDIQALGQTAVAGQADCLGGAAYRTRSYEVSEAALPGIDEAGVVVGPVALDAKFAAKVTAHEMGHLFGGQHHYADCVEGVNPAQEASTDTSPCTLMGNASDFDSLHFSTLNATVVRGYALTYAASNDDLAPTPAVDEAPAGGAAAGVAVALVAGGLVLARRRRSRSAG